MLPAFTLWLSKKNYSSSTIRNYCTDIRKYQFWIQATQSPSLNSKIATAFTTKALNQYLSVILGQNSFDRQLASLRLFCQFAQDQNMIQNDVFTISLKAFNNRKNTANNDISESESLVAEFKKYLHTQNASPNTIRSYLNDIKDYLIWIHA